MSGPIRSVAQAFAILRLLAASGPLSLSDIGRKLELSPSSCFNLLKTLLAEQAIERDARTKYYRLAAVWAAAEGLRDGPALSLPERAVSLITPFAQRWDAAVGLWQIISRDRMQLVARAESDAVMRIQLAEAQRQPLGGGAAGRAIAAGQGIDAGELARRFAAVRWQADLPFAAYAEQVRDARARGYAIDAGFAHRGIYTVAVAIVEVAPGFCLSASTLVGAADETDAIGTDLVRLKAALVSDQRGAN